MVFQLFKRRGSPATSSSSSNQQPPYPSIAVPSSSSSTNSSGYTSRTPPYERTKSSSNLFTDAFRSSSSSRDSHHPPPPLPAQSSSSSSSRVLRVDTQNVQQQHGKESWDYLGVPLRGSSNLNASSPSSTLGPPDRRKIFEGREASGGGNSTLSLPLRMDDREPEKKSRWTLGRGPKRRTGSTSSISTLSAADKEHAKKEAEKHGFVVRSFRSVSRVQEDPISRGPYESLPSRNNLASVAGSPSLPSLPFSDSSPYPSSAPPRRPALNIRAPGANNWLDAERAPSPTISVEAFRLASARSKSSISLQSMSSLDTPVERPRFEPSRSRRSSTHIESIPSPLAPPRPQFAAQHSSSPHSGISPAVSSSSLDYDAASQQMNQQLSASGSLASVGSYQTASEGGMDDERRDKRASRRISDGWNDELRLIALYGVDAPDDASPPLQVKQLPPPPQVFPTAGRSRLSEPQPTPRFSPTRPASRSTPSLFLQPATPTQSSSASKTTVPRPISSPFPAPSSSPAKPGKPPARLAWASGSSDEEEADVPLARLSHIRTSSGFGQSRPTDIGGAPLQKTGSREVEVLATESLSKASSSVSHVSSSNILPTATVSAGPTRSALVGSEESISRRSTQRRSMSTLSFSTFSAPPASATIPTSTLDSPSLGHRTYSNPSSPAVGAATFSATDLPLLPSFSSTLLDQRNSSSSSSGSGSGSSLPQTPKDITPATSMLGVGAKSSERLVKFDIQSLSNDADRRWSSRMSSAPVPRSSMAASSFGSSQPRPVSMVSLQTPQSTMGRRPPFVQQHQGSRSVDQLSQMSSNAPAKDDVYGRMKARHQAETLNGLAIGKDLNSGGRLRDEEDEDEDDDAPLASLPSRGGGARSQAGSSYGGYQQQPSFFPHPSSIGGYSQLHSAPPGVDPYLYASLPPDQKMGLHHRAQQMMAMMAQAAEQAKAESTAGWESGSSTGSDGRRGSRMSGSRSGDMSMLGGGGMSQSMPSMGYGFGYPMTMPGGRLPPFAPSMQMSQTFFNEQPPNPYYAGSAMGYPGAQSAVGAPTGRSGGGQPRGSASVIGTGRR